MENNEQNPSQGRKKSVHENYKRNVIKKSRVRGEPYKNTKGVYIPGKKMGPICR